MAKKFVLSAYLKNAIRRLSYRHPMRAAAWAAVRVPRPADWPNQRVKWVAPCVACKKLFEQSETQCDHIEPIIPVSGWPLAPQSPLYETEPDDKDMNVLVYRTFVCATKLQIMCKTCHKIKSNEENQRRKEMRHAEKAKLGLDKPSIRVRLKRTKTK
jgi:5-methylcytosine-specific restriction endonuclease McrA